MRTGLPKYTRAWAGFAALFFLGSLIQHRVPAPFDGWCLMTSMVCLTLALVFFVIGMVAERRSGETRRRVNEPSNNSSEAIP